VNMEASWGVSQ